MSYYETPGQGTFQCPYCNSSYEFVFNGQYWTFQLVSRCNLADQADHLKKRADRVAFIRNMSPLQKRANEFYISHPEFWLIPVDETDTDATIQKAIAFAAAFAQAEQ